MRPSGFSQAVLITARREQPPTSIPAEKTGSFWGFYCWDCRMKSLKKILNSLFMSFFLAFFFFFYDWTYAGIRNDRRTCGSFCLLDQSPEPYRYWALGECMDLRGSGLLWASFVTHRNRPGLSITTVCHFSVSLILNLAVDRAVFSSAHLL